MVVAAVDCRTRGPCETWPETHLSPCCLPSARMRMRLPGPPAHSVLRLPAFRTVDVYSGHTAGRPLRLPGMSCSCIACQQMRMPSPSATVLYHGTRRLGSVYKAPPILRCMARGHPSKCGEGTTQPSSVSTHEGGKRFALAPVLCTYPNRSHVAKPRQA